MEQLCLIPPQDLRHCQVGGPPLKMVNNTEKLLFVLRNKAAHFSFSRDFTLFFCVTYSKSSVTPRDEGTRDGLEKEEMESGEFGDG